MFATSSLDHSEARNDHGRRVKQEFKNECDETANFWIAQDSVFFCFVWKGAFFNLQEILHNKRGLRRAKKERSRKEKKTNTTSWQVSTYL